MPNLKVLYTGTQTQASTAQTANGAAVDASGSTVLSAQCNITVDTPSAKTFIDGTKQVQTVTTVADSSGSLNSTFFTLQSINTVTGASKGWYIWFNINSAGVDPAPAGRTAIPITGATNVSANTLATSIRSALGALTSDFDTATGSNAAVIVNNLNPGLVTAAADGTAATGFTFAAPSTPGVNSKVNPVLDQITIASHGLPTGLKGQLTISTGTLPAGLSTSTDYFVIVVDANTISLASSLALAQAGTAIDITGYGTCPATCTFTPTSIAGATVQLQKSNDGSNWVNQGSSVSVTATGSYWLENVDPAGASYRVQYTLTAGSLSSSTVWRVQGNN